MNGPSQKQTGRCVPPQEDRIRELARMQACAQQMSYRRKYPAAQNSIVAAGPMPVGRMLVDVRGYTVRFVDVALLPEWHGRDIGTRLLADIQQGASELGAPVS